jgi:histidine triad (HIT) family protein
MAPCPFCQRIATNQYDHAYGTWAVRFEPLNPVAPGHMLFVPREHVADVTEDTMLTGIVYRYAAEWAGEMDEDCNLITSVGRDATQTVFHLHVHYVPRRPGDGLSLPWSRWAKP